MIIKNNCQKFNGEIPCKPHKLDNVHCEDCPYFEPLNEKILIIKLGAAGDVIRTTPILRKLKEEFPLAEINWLTHSPEFVPGSYVHNILEWDPNTILWLQTREFDYLLNLDKDRKAISLAEMIKAKTKKGFLIDGFGKCKPADNGSNNKWLTGLFDDLNKQNIKSYPEEIFEMLGFSYHKEKYILELPAKRIDFDLPLNQRIVGLNTGCGTRWLTRLWGKDNWIELADKLADNGFYPILLGGPTEDELNFKIAAKSSAEYKGIFSLTDFADLVNNCDLIVTSVTMAMHIAIALEKKLVLLNNIFNKNEFELYGLGEILQPEGKDCLGCYKNTCEQECMRTISSETVFETIENLLRM